MDTTVYTTLNRPELVAFLRSLPGRLSGRVQDPQGIGRGFAARIGWVFYMLVAKSFATKGRGGTDEAGDSWPPNTAAYLAYTKGRAKHRKNRHSYRINRTAHLDAHDRKVWARANTEALAENVLSMPYHEAKAAAAVTAWAATRAFGADTLISTYGKMPDQVLVDRGDLRRSLQQGDIVETPGVDADYRPADGNQVYEQSTGQVVLGTKDPKAAYHHNSKKLKHGDGQRGTVRRRLWPESLPDGWWREIVEQTSAGLRRIGALVQNGDIR